MKPQIGVHTHFCNTKIASTFAAGTLHATVLKCHACPHLYSASVLISAPRICAVFTKIVHAISRSEDVMADPITKDLVGNNTCLVSSNGMTTDGSTVTVQLTADESLPKKNYPYLEDLVMSNFVLDELFFQLQEAYLLNQKL